MSKDDASWEEFSGNPFTLSDEEFLEFQDTHPKKAAAMIIRQAVDFHEGRYIDQPNDPRLREPNKFGGAAEVLKRRYEDRFGRGRKPSFHDLIPTSRD
jgi:hypothetical protein